jgi:hypothetical protein
MISDNILQFLSTISYLQNGNHDDYNFTVFLSTLTNLTSIQKNFIEMRYNALYPLIPNIF